MVHLHQNKTKTPVAKIKKKKTNIMFFGLPT